MTTRERAVLDACIYLKGMRYSPFALRVLYRTIDLLHEEISKKQTKGGDS